jgi:hypothetical protein
MESALARALRLHACEVRGGHQRTDDRERNDRHDQRNAAASAG